jgi:hypothetical protein
MTIMRTEFKKERSKTKLPNRILRRRSRTGYMATCAAYLSFFVQKLASENPNEAAELP